MVERRHQVRHLLVQRRQPFGARIKRPVAERNDQRPRHLPRREWPQPGHGEMFRSGTLSPVERPSSRYARLSAMAVTSRGISYPLATKSLASWSSSAGTEGQVAGVHLVHRIDQSAAEEVFPHPVDECLAQERFLFQGDPDANRLCAG